MPLHNCKTHKINEHKRAEIIVRFMPSIFMLSQIDCYNKTSGLVLPTGNTLTNHPDPTAHQYTFAIRCDIFLRIKKEQIRDYRHDSKAP